MRKQIFVGTLIVAIVMMAISVAAITVVRSELLRRSQAEIERQATVTAAILDQQLTTAIRDGRAGSFSRTLAQLRLLGGHDYMEVAALTPDGPEPLVNDPVLLSQLTDAAGGPLRVEVDGDPVLATVREVSVGTRSWIVAIGRTEPLLVSGLLARPLVIALGLGVVTAALMAVLLSRRFGRRIDQLTAVSTTLADGDFSVRAEVTGEDEIATLARSLNAMADELVSARRRERDFLMSVGHDLRTPLTTIRGYVEALDDGAIPPDELPRIVAVLQRQTDRLTRLVDDLGKLARLEAREFSLAEEPVRLAAHLDETVAAFRPMAMDMGVRLDADLPDVGVGSVDPDRVGQIVDNLLDNALRWTPEGGRVTVGLRTAPGTASIVVADTGPGIESADLPRIFERTFVAHRYQPVRHHGSGLGLAIVRELAAAMGGSVAAASAVGSGTEITVTLPWLEGEPVAEREI